jgi:hypothetical protein
VRMWGIEPKNLCNQHLLGEHLEMHMFLGCIKKGISLKGYYDNKLVCTNLIKIRHDDLVIEMISRGMNHNSPIVDMDFFKDFKYGEIDLDANVNELMSRCPKCKERFINKQK